jgi:hypothetical protein
VIGSRVGCLRSKLLKAVYVIRVDAEALLDRARVHLASSQAIGDVWSCSRQRGGSAEGRPSPDRDADCLPKCR